MWMHLPFTMVLDRRLLINVCILFIVIQRIDGIQMTLDVPSPLQSNQEVTAVCSAEEVYGSYHLAWYLNGVQISDGVTTTPSVSRVAKLGAWILSIRYYRAAIGTHCTKVCDGSTVRLVGGTNEKEGRVEIQCGGIWGTICDWNGWGIEEAHVVCRQLGYPRASAHFVNAHFGQGSGPVWQTHGVYCPTGNENSLLECFRLPWGCNGQGWSTCGHDQDAGVRCEGERNLTATAERYAESRRKVGLAYGFTESVYYNVRSEFTFSSASISNGDVLQCHVLGFVRSARLQLSGPAGDCDGDGAPPNGNILSIETTEIRGEDTVVSLFITCQVNVTAQPSPPLHTYTLAVDNINISSSSSASTLFAPRPNKCINVTCLGTNGHGVTTAWLEHCPQDRPAPDIISIDYKSVELEDETILNVTCHVNPADQPFPPIHTFTITADDHVISSSEIPSATFEPTPTTCIHVSCMGLNDFGETFKSDTYCPPDAGAEPRAPADNILAIETLEIRGEGNQVTLIINCHVALDDQPYPHLHTYEIVAENTTLSSSSCASGILPNRPDRCISVTCSGTNGLGSTSTHLTHCPTPRVKAGPTAGPRRGALQKSSTTYSLLIVIFVLSVVTLATVFMKRRKTSY